VLCASPAYLAEHGVPPRPQALSSHHLLIVGSENQPAIQISSEDETHELRTCCRMRSNNSVAVARAAEAGLGIALLPSYVAAPALNAGRLVPVLPGWRARESSVYAQYLAGRHIVPKVRAFIDALAEAAPTLHTA